ncbi:MAG: 23S rRNA (cytosine(1962)-C(5))-methyltransferase RlmI [Bacteroidetes bacterium]|nr:23S rRNA (cytosine(1962)-C(5))-methyltransferase RlmI [Bacteroidota bacterium]
MPQVILKKSRERSVLQHHPWIFSGAVERTEDVAENGQTVGILSSQGEPLAMAAWSRDSQICARIWSFNPNQKIDTIFIRELIRHSVERRKSLFNDPGTNAFRLINAESDGFPGLIADRYDGYVVCQFLSAGAEYWRITVLEALQESINPTGIYERSDTESRLKEGLEKKSGTLAGNEPPEIIQIVENGINYAVNIMAGHKTGFYLDQRDNRKILQPYSHRKEILNCFSYSGGFGISSLIAGAKHVTNIDSSSESLDLLVQNLNLNGIGLSGSLQVEGDVFKILRTYRDSRKSFDIIVLDPPKFAESKSQLESALRGYKDINLLALKLLNPGGYLFTFSCSGHIVPELFLKIVSEAASDSGRKVELVRTLMQSADHPVILGFPESLYLKGLICRVG